MMCPSSGWPCASCRRLLPRSRAPVPQSRIRSVPASVRTSTHEVFPPYRMTVGLGTGIEPRTPQNFRRIRSNRPVPDPDPHPPREPGHRGHASARRGGRLSSVPPRLGIACLLGRGRLVDGLRAPPVANVEDEPLAAAELRLVVHVAQVHRIHLARAKLEEALLGGILVLHAEPDMLHARAHLDAGVAHAHREHREVDLAIRKVDWPVRATLDQLEAEGLTQKRRGRLDVLGPNRDVADLGHFYSPGTNHLRGHCSTVGGFPSLTIDTRGTKG